MPNRLHNGLALVLGGLLVATPTESAAQRHGHGGGWHGGHRGGGYVYAGRHGYAGNAVYYGRRGYGAYPVYGGYGGPVAYPAYGYGAYGAYGAYGGYAGYPGYYGYGGYYDHHYHNDGAWIALGAGVVGVIVGSILARPRVYYYPVEAPPPPAPPPPPQPAPVTPRCQDGSPVPVGGYCTAPPAEPAPRPARG